MFYDPALFPFLDPLRDAWREIRADFVEALPALVPWVEAHNHNGKWVTAVLHHTFGADIVPEFSGAAFTRDLCSRVPGVRTFAFSVLLTGAEVSPHVDHVPGVLRAHLGLCIPDNCGLRCGEHTRQWREGEWLVFDENVLHSAWNKGAADRVILLVDFERDTP